MCRIGMFVEEGRKEDRAQLSKLTLSDALRYSLVEEERERKKKWFVIVLFVNCGHSFIQVSWLLTLSFYCSLPSSPKQLFPSPFLFTVCLTFFLYL